MRPLVGWALALVACGGDVDLDRQRRALEAWEDAKVALEAHDPTRAEAELDRALTLDPGDPVLQVWSARASADAGRVDVALQKLEALLRTRPGYGPALYDRAAYLARQGEPEAAAQALEVALAAGVDRSPEELRSDPDFAPWLDHPAIAALLPEPALRTALEGPEGAVFRGSEFGVHLRVFGAGEEPISVAADEVAGPIVLVGVVEQARQSTAGAMRDVTWTFRVEGAGPIRLGHLRVVAGRRVADAGDVRVDAFAPPGREVAPPPVLPTTLLTPREVRGGGALPSVARSGDAVVVLTGAGDRVEVTPPAEGVRYEERGDDGVLWVGWRFPGSVQRVRVRRAGADVLDARP